MSLKPVLLSLFLLTAGASAQESAVPAKVAADAPLAQLTPEGAISYAEFPRPAAAWKTLRESGAVDHLTRSESYAEALRTPEGLRLVGGFAAIRAILGVDMDAALTGLAGGGVALAAWAPEKPGSPPDYVFLVRGGDRALLERARDGAAEFAGLLSMGEWISTDVKVDKREFGSLGSVETIAYKKESYHAFAGNLLVASNRASILTDVLRLASGVSTESIANQESYRAAKKTAGESGAFLWLDMDRVAETKKELRDPENALEPFPALIFGGLHQAFVGSPWAALSVNVEPWGLSLAARTAVKPVKSVNTYLPKESAVPDVNIPRFMGSLVLRRDVEAFWQDHDGIVAAEFDADFAKFNSVAATIFGVRRMDEDVFAKLEPVAQWVFARQTFDGYREAPNVKIPAFGLILQLREDNKKLSDGFRRAFQTAVAIASADRAQKEQMGWGLSEETMNDVKISYATFPEPDNDEPVVTEYNYSPAFFSKGRYLILTSTHELARDLMSSMMRSDLAFEESPARPKAVALRVVDTLDLTSAELRMALSDNLETLTAQAMLKDGKSKSQARRELRFLGDVMALFSDVRAELAEEERGMVVKARLRFAPAGKPSASTESRPRQVTR